MTLAILDARETEYVLVAAGGDLIATYVVQAIAAGETAQAVLDAILAAGLAEGVFPSLAAGEGATTDGQYFWVGAGGTVTLYVNDSGTGDEIAQLATAADLALRPTFTQLAASSGAGLSGFQQPDTGSVLSDLGARARKILFLDEDFGAVGDGVTDDAPAWVAAQVAALARGGTMVFVPDPPVAYLLGSNVPILQNCGFVGQTYKSTKIIHGFNGHLFTMGEGAVLENFDIDGDGATFTGRCMDFQGSAGRQSVRGIRATGWEDEVMYFATNAGSQSDTSHCTFARRNAGTTTGRYAVVIDPAQQLSARPRKFSFIETDGTCSFHFGGSNNTYVSDSFIGDVAYNADSRAVLMTGTRIANQLAMPVDGHNNAFSGCDISPQPTIASGADMISFAGNSYNNLPIINNSGNGRVFVECGAIAYTPTLTSGGTAPVLGNGTITGLVSQSGSLVNVTINITIGSTTTLGTGDLRASLPTWAPNSTAIVQVPGTAILTRSTTNYTAAVQLPNATQWVRMIRDTSGSVTFNSPATWATGDTMRISFTYMM